jgi:hypothetical protein
MPETDAEIQAEGGKRVTITIAELTEAELANTTTADPASDLNTFVIYSGKYRLTITIAE